MNVGVKSPMSLQNVRRMSATQMAKLTKDQLVSALREAVKVPTTEAEVSNTPSSTPTSVSAITIEAIDKLLKQRLEPVTQTISMLTEEMRELKVRVQELERKSHQTVSSGVDLIPDIANEVEQRIIRAKNVVISGLNILSEGSVEERKKDDKNKCEELLRNIDISDFEIVATHRIGKPLAGKPQLIKVIMGSVDSKHEIMRKAKQLRNYRQYRQVYINPDRTPRQQLENRMLLEEWKSRRESGEEVVIFKQRVVARDSLKNFQGRF